MASAIVDRDTLILAFQLQEFLGTRHAFTSNFDDVDRHIITYLVRQNFRPAQSIRSLSSRDERARSRSQSVEVRSWPTEWAVNVTAIRAAIARFRTGTQLSRQLLRIPVSTGNTPSTSPPPSVTTESFPPESGSDQNSTRATSAEETIFTQPIGPENSNANAMANVQDPAIQAIITAAIAQYVRENPPPRGEPGQPGQPGAPGRDGTDGVSSGARAQP